MTAQQIYDGSDGAATTAFYKELESLGPIGIVAVNLFRAQKTSSRAKKYGRTKYRGLSYDKKNWSLHNLCSALAQHGETLEIAFGWKQDPRTIAFEWVLYIDLACGQVSFHSPSRGEGPDYAGEWDGQRKSAERVIAFCESVKTLQRCNVTTTEPDVHDWENEGGALAAAAE